jgi:uncharacterized protein (TIGR02145 family)
LHKANRILTFKTLLSVVNVKKSIMKKKKIIPCTFLLLFSLFLIHSCKKEKPAPPAIITAAITNITPTTVTSGGNVTNEGGAPVISRGVCWNTSLNPTISNNMTIDSAGPGIFVSHLTNLVPNTEYFVRAYATNSGGTVYGDHVSFRTRMIEMPTLTTNGISSVTETTAITGGNITSDNGGPILARGVCWSSTMQYPTISNNKTSDGSGTGNFVSIITGINGNTIYYVRAYATNSVGTNYGQLVGFLSGPTVASLSTIEVNSLTLTSAKSGGNITSDGRSPVTSRGICWSSSQHPSTLDHKTTNGTGSGSFTGSMTGLSKNTEYFVRSYAINSVGTAYGNEVSFITPTYGSLTDIEGNVYKTILAGNQVWMAENLKTTRYSNGDIIGTTIPVTYNIYSEISPKYQWAVNGIESLVEIYGRIYTGYAVTDSRNICPTGWHVPTDAEWEVLINYAGGTWYGGKLKETGIAHWPAFNSDATDEFGFTAIPAGARSSINFTDFGTSCFWWSSTNFMDTNCWVYYLHDNSSIINKDYRSKGTGVTVRCLKN